MTEESIIELLRQKQGERTQLAFANEIGIHQAYLCDVYKGNRKASGSTKILEFLGIEKRVLFEFKRKRV